MGVEKMISANMKVYDFYTFGESDGYGQAQLSDEKQGSIIMAIYVTSQSVQDNINYHNANYLGLTLDLSIDESYVIQYGEKKLKVLYVNKQGRFTQVFMSEI